MVSGEQKDKTSGRYYGIIVTGEFLGRTENSKQNKAGFSLCFQPYPFLFVWEVFFPLTSPRHPVSLCVCMFLGSHQSTHSGLPFEPYLHYLTILFPNKTCLSCVSVLQGPIGWKEFLRSWSKWWCNKCSQFIALTSQEHWLWDCSHWWLIWRCGQNENFRPCGRIAGGSLCSF